MQRTRIVLALPPHMLLLSDLIAGVLEAEDDCEVVVERGSDPFAAATSREVDVLITTADVAPPGKVDALLTAHPRLRAIAVEGDAKEAVVYELSPDREQVRPLSRTALLDVVFRPRRTWFA